jgi:hypothetical protein
MSFPNFPKITSNDQLVVGQWYWCRTKFNVAADVSPHQVRETSGFKYVGVGDRMWCDPKNDQFLGSFDAWGPIPRPHDAGVPGTDGQALSRHTPLKG